MKTIINTVAFLLLGFGVNAQTEAQLVEWQANNPGKIVMTHANYDLLDSETQQLIASTIVFKDEISIGIFGTGQTTEVGSSQFTDVNFVKDWMSKNQDTKIVTRSEYNAARPDIQALYDQPFILVLIGDELTKQDILNF